MDFKNKQIKEEREILFFMCSLFYSQCHCPSPGPYHSPPKTSSIFPPIICSTWTSRLIFINWLPMSHSYSKSSKSPLRITFRISPRHSACQSKSSTFGPISFGHLIIYQFTNMNFLHSPQSIYHYPKALWVLLPKTHHLACSDHTNSPWSLWP